MFLHAWWQTNLGKINSPSVWFRLKFFLAIVVDSSQFSETSSIKVFVLDKVVCVCARERGRNKWRERGRTVEWERKMERENWRKGEIGEKSEAICNLHFFAFIKFSFLFHKSLRRKKEHLLNCFHALSLSLFLSPSLSLSNTHTHSLTFAFLPRGLQKARTELFHFSSFAKTLFRPKEISRKLKLNRNKVAKKL